jgi:hypothetical protein
MHGDLGGLVTLLFILICGAIALGFFVLWIWMLIHAITNRRISDTEKLLWVVVIIFVPVLGPIIYFVVGRPKAG